MLARVSGTRARSHRRDGAAAGDCYRTRMGPAELWIVVGVIVLLFGGSQLPKLARSLGEAKREFESGQGESTTTKSTDTKSDTTSTDTRDNES
jgi:sec-independent protein translocase protein TatA